MCDIVYVTAHFYKCTALIMGPKSVTCMPKAKTFKQGIYGIGCTSKTLQSVNIYKSDLGDAYFDSGRM